MLSKWVPIRFIITQWIPLIFIFELPNNSWGLLIKIVLGLWLLQTLKSAFSPMFDKLVSGFGAGIFLKSLWFSLIWLLAPHWSIYIFLFLLVTSFATMFWMIDKHNKEYMSALYDELKKNVEGEDDR